MGSIKNPATCGSLITDLSAYLIQVGDTFGLCGSYVAPVDTLIVKTIDSTYYKQLDSIKLLLIQVKDSIAKEKRMRDSISGKLKPVQKIIPEEKNNIIIDTITNPTP